MPSKYLRIKSFMTERDLQNYLKKQCKSKGLLFHKLESKSSRGFPDCMIAYDGRVSFIELKSPKGTGSLHPLQINCITKMLDHRLDVRVIDNKTDVDLAIKQIKRD